MAQEQLDAVLAELATLEHDLEGRHDILYRMGDAMLRQPVLGAQLVARMLASPKDAAEMEDMSLLLGIALDTARMAHENRQARGSKLLSAVEESLALGARQGALELSHRLLFASIWARNGLQAPAVLELTEADLASAQAEIGDLSPEAMIDRQFDDLEERLGEDPTGFHAVLSELLPTMPVELRRHVVHIATLRPAPLYAELGTLWLLDPEPAIRLAAAEGLAARLKAGLLTGETTAALVMLRSWMPEEAPRALLDQILRDALRADVAPAETPAAWTVREIRASLPDGAGAQSIGIALRSGREHAIAMLLLKQLQGVKDAFVIHSVSAAEQKTMLRRLISETDAIEVPPAWLEQTLAMALGEGLEAGRPPAPALIEIARLCGLGALRPQAVSTDDLVARLARAPDIAEMSAQARGRLLAQSEDWWSRHEIVENWFEQSDSVDELLDKPGNSRALRSGLWKWLETRREWWARIMAQSAHLLEATGHADAPAFVATAMALTEGRDLKKIPIMVDILDQTVEAWLANAEATPEEALPGDRVPDVALSEVDGTDPLFEAPEPERRGEFARLLKGADISPGWIDGFLMAVVIAPKVINPDRWMSEILNAAVAALHPEMVERFLEVVMMRTHTTIDQSQDRVSFTSAMSKRGKKAKRDWATGFSHGYDTFRSGWPAKSTGADDRAMIKFISGKAKAEFSPEDIGTLALWIEARGLRTHSRR